MARKSRTEKNEKVVKESQKQHIYEAGLYRRLSVEADGDDESLHSIGNQQKIAEDYVLNDTSVRIKKVYTDNGVSGMTYNREGFSQMMNDLYAGIIDCIIVKDISRLGRHLILTSELVEKTFPAMNIRLICINDNYDSIDPQSDSETLLMQIKMVMNDNYAKDFSKKIRSSINAKMGAGEYLPSSSSIPYGYIRNPKENTFDVDEEAAVVVKKIYELRSQGYAFNAIARQLNEEGYPSPGRLRFERGLTKSEKFEKSVWVRGAIRKISSDPVYTGCRIHGKVKRDRLGENKTRRNQDEWQIIENAHEPIIPNELFDAVQKVNAEALEERSKQVKRVNPADDKRDLLKDKVFCADCGSKMTARKSIGRVKKNGEQKTSVIYDCNRYVDTGKVGCKSHYVRQSTITNALTSCLKKQLSVALDYEELIEQVQSIPKIAAYQNEKTSSVASVQAKITNIMAKKEHMMEDYLDEIISVDEYEYMKSRLELQQVQLQKELNQLKAEADELSQIGKNSETWLNSIKCFESIDTFSRELLDLLVERILVYDKDHVEIELAYADPFKTLNAFIDKVGEKYAS